MIANARIIARMKHNAGMGRCIIEDSKELLTSSVVRKAMLGLVDRIKTVDAAPAVHGRWVKLSEAFEWNQKGRWVKLREALEWDRKECSVCGER